MSRGQSSGIPPLLRDILLVPSTEGQDMAHDLLRRFFPLRALTVHSHYVYAEGTLPVLLIAHTDTVHDEPPRALYFDRSHRILWSPDGLGADDRAGVYAITLLLQRGLRPHVLLTDLEEVGGVGASHAAATLPPPTVNCLIQLDRRGTSDMVQYDGDNPELLALFRPYGYRLAPGSFSDISLLAPAWDRAAVNLSIGYRNEHSRAELLALTALDGTVNAVAQFLSHPPHSPLPYNVNPCPPPLPSRGYRIVQRGLPFDAPLTDYDESGDYLERWR